MTRLIGFRGRAGSSFTPIVPIIALLSAAAGVGVVVAQDTGMQVPAATAATNPPNAKNVAAGETEAKRLLLLRNFFCERLISAS